MMLAMSLKSAHTLSISTGTEQGRHTWKGSSWQLELLNTGETIGQDAGLPPQVST